MRRETVAGADGWRQVSSGLAELQSNTTKASAFCGELRQRMILRQQEYAKEVNHHWRKLPVTSGERGRRIQNLSG
jgi:hypothetical protein